MNFYEWLITGGIEFMATISLVGILILGLVVKKGVDFFVYDDLKPKQLRWGLGGILYLGSLAFALGILAQAIGIYQALVAIEKWGKVSPALLAGGLKVSMIAPMYGLIIFILSSIFWFLLRMRYLQLMRKFEE